MSNLHRILQPVCSKIELDNFSFLPFPEFCLKSLSHRYKIFTGKVFKSVLFSAQYFFAARYFSSVLHILYWVDVMLDNDNTHDLLLGNVGWRRGHGTMLLGPCIPSTGLGRPVLGLAMPRGWADNLIYFNTRHSYWRVYRYRVCPSCIVFSAGVLST